MGTNSKKSNLSVELSEFQLVVREIKKILRTQKISYEELAKNLGLSVSGLKKFLGAEDGSFERLSKICRFLGASLSDILDESASQQVHISLSQEQQQAFLKSPELFEVYWKLAYERLAQEEIQKKWGIRDAKMFSILRSLDRLNLVKLAPSGKAKVPGIRPVTWVGRGPFIQKLYKNWTQSIFEKFSKNETKESEYFLLRYLKVHEDTFQELLMAQKQIENEFLKRSIREMRLNRPGLINVRWVVGVDNESFIAAPVG